MVERSLSMREVPGSIPGASNHFFFVHDFEFKFNEITTQHQNMIWFIALKGLLQESVEKLLYVWESIKFEYSPLPEVPGEGLITSLDNKIQSSLCHTW